MFLLIFIKRLIDEINIHIFPGNTPRLVSPCIDVPLASVAIERTDSLELLPSTRYYTLQGVLTIIITTRYYTLQGVSTIIITTRYYTLQGVSTIIITTRYYTLQGVSTIIITQGNFSIPISLKPNIVDPRHFEQCILLNQIILV